MLSLVLIIKGNKHQAAKAAADRNIPLAFIREKNGETIGRSPEDHRDAIVEWFAETGPSASPYPIGTLLHYVDA